MYFSSIEHSNNIRKQYQMETPLINNLQAMKYFHIKDLETWREFRRTNKIPFCQVGKQKLFHTDELNKIALKLSKESLRTYEN
jgi:hypothetical protein